MPARTLSSAVCSRAGTESQSLTTSRTSAPSGTVTLPGGPQNFTGPAIRPSLNTRVASRARSLPATYQRPFLFTTPHGSSSRRCGSLRPAAR